jgi:hypothetical protein
MKVWSLTKNAPAMSTQRETTATQIDQEKQKFEYLNKNLNQKNKKNQGTGYYIGAIKNTIRETGLLSE